MAPLAWAGAIFLASSIPGDSLPDAGVPGLDKAVHVLVFGILGWLLGGALGARTAGRVGLAAILAAAYGIVDELHQGLVPGRDPDVWDVAADALGAALGAISRAVQVRRLERS